MVMAANLNDVGWRTDVRRIRIIVHRASAAVRRTPRIRVNLRAKNRIAVRQNPYFTANCMTRGPLE